MFFNKIGDVETAETKQNEFNFHLNNFHIVGLAVCVCSMLNIFFFSFSFYLFFFILSLIKENISG